MTVTQPLASFLMSRRGFSALAGVLRGASGSSRSTSVSWYSSSIVTRSVTAALAASAATMRHSSRSARGISPGAASEPLMVCVLPLPVWPYAKRQTL